MSQDICEKSYSIRISKDPFRHILELVSLKFKKLLEGFRFNEMKKEQDYLEVSKTLSKGQIISKWFFGVFDFLQKTNENKSI